MILNNNKSDSKQLFIKHLYKDNFEFIIYVNNEQIIEELEKFISFDKTPSIGTTYDKTIISFVDKSSLGEKIKNKVEQGNTIKIHGGTPEQHVFGKKISSENKNLYYIPINDEYIIQEGNQYLLYGGNQGQEENLYRVVREIYYRKSLALGRVTIHSAAVCDKKGNCILIPGEKAAGKTTFLCNLLASNKYIFLDNDRLLISIDNDGTLSAHSMSSTVNVGYGTMSTFPEKFKGMRITGYSKFADKKRYTRREFIRQMQCDYRTSGKVKSIIFPRIEERSSIKLVNCSIEEKLQRIENTIEKYDSSEHPDWLGISNVSEEQYRENVLKILQYIKKNIPAKEMHFGYERIKDNDMNEIDGRGE